MKNIMKNRIDNYIKVCLTVISGSILLVLMMIGGLFTYVFFFDTTETTQVDRRQEHVDQHIREAEKLEEIIKVLEEINKNFDERKN